jgi:ACT domain-containing protein
MPRYVIRVRLLDRPGGLGAVASRIGAVGGDIVAIDILDRSGGRAIDEFVVELSGEHLVELLRHEIHEVDGAIIEEFRQVADASQAEE